MGPPDKEFFAAALNRGLINYYYIYHTVPFASPLATDKRRKALLMYYVDYIHLQRRSFVAMPLLSTHLTTLFLVLLYSRTKEEDTPI